MLQLWHKQTITSCLHLPRLHSRSYQISFFLHPQKTWIIFLAFHLVAFFPGKDLVRLSLSWLIPLLQKSRWGGSSQFGEQILCVSIRHILPRIRRQVFHPIRSNIARIAKFASANVTLNCLNCQATKIFMISKNVKIVETIKSCQNCKTCQNKQKLQFFKLKKI